MFLLDAAPRGALPGEWQPFAPAVRARVHVILGSLRGPAGPGRRLLRGGRAGGGSGRPQPPRAPAPRAPRARPAGSEGRGREDDSDDSVDREIEEAIQEHLRDKGPAARGSLRKDGPSPDTDGPAQAPALAPAPARPGDDALRWAPSPGSLSSDDDDDSFEQSITAEIERFLSEKKQHARKKTASARRKGPCGKKAQGKATRQKSRTSKVSLRPLKQGGQVLFLRRHPELRDTSAPLESWMPKTQELVAVRKTSRGHLSSPGAGHSCILEQRNGGEIRQRFGKAGAGQGPETAHVSDSSSDDGIEEAIQLYQLEKVRKAANAQACWVPSQKEEFGAGGLADRSASLTIHSEKSALPENPRTAPSSKRKQISPKPSELNRISAICNELGKSRHCHSPANKLAGGTVTSQTCRTDTAAELMCAEAILDFSKTILPPPVASDSRTLRTDPFFDSQSAPPSHQESDSNLVDSDDSIEQEIRAFLAIKAQAERLITKPDEASNTAPNPLSCGQLDNQIRSPKQSFPNTLKLSLDHKRQLNEESSIARQRQDEQMALFKMGCSHLDNDDHSMPFVSQKENVLSHVKNSDMGRAPRQQDVCPAAVSPVDFVTPLSQGLLARGGLLKNARQALQKYSADDKSSSLDSDEDLDTAIKDLLRSRRKLKKKSKDQKIQCKKKVRFGNAEMHIFEEKLEVLQEKACKSKKPAFLKSCLMSSRRNIKEESTQKQSQYMVKRRPKRTEAVRLALTFEKGCQFISGPDNQEAAGSDQHPRIDTPVMEDSSSLDSDDSIEQEIQRFLAEKARDSSGFLEIGGGFEIVDTGKAAQPQTTQPKAKRPQLGGVEAALSKQKKAKKGCQLMTELISPLRTGREAAENVSRVGEQTVTFRENLHSQAIVKLQGNQGIVQTKGADLFVKRTGLDRKGVSEGKLVQRNLPSWKEKAENGKLPNYFKPMSLFRRKSPREFKISCKLIAGFKSPQKKGKSVLLRKSQSIELSIPQSNVLRRQEGLLGERWKPPVQKGILGSKSKTEEADLYQRCMAVEFYPPVSEKMEVAPLSIGVVSPAKAGPLDDEELCSHADSQPSSLLQDPSEVHVRSAPSEIPVKEKEGKVQNHSNSWERFSAPKSCDSPPKERVLLTHQDRIAEKEIHKDFEDS